MTQRNVVGRCRPWPIFALVVAQSAWALGWKQAAKKAFVADGSANNGRRHAGYFGSFVALRDFIHALRYVFAAAATAGRGFAPGWECYQKWISWVWQGQVRQVIEALQQRQQDVGLPEEGESQTSVRSVVARALGYLGNEQDKMSYDASRKQGLPLTSSLMESVVKPMNYRVKGSEKFWCGGGALGDRAVARRSPRAPTRRWRSSSSDATANATGQRPYRRAA